MKKGVNSFKMGLGKEIGEVSYMLLEILNDELKLKDRPMKPSKIV